MDTPGSTDPDWRQYDPDLAIASPILRRMLALWQERRGTRAMPSRQDFAAEDLMQFSGRVLLIDVEYAPRRYRFRLVGTLIVDLLQRDLTGRYFDDVYTPAQLAVLARSSDYCTETRRPLRIMSRLNYADRSHIQIEVLEMPLSSDGTTVDMIMKCVVEQDEADPA